MEAEEAIIGIPTSVCQPALSPLVRVRVDKESAKRFQSHIPHFFFFSLRGLWREEGEICVCVCVCVLVIVCVCACVFWISVLLHNKSLLNKCKADGTVVSPPWGEKEREKEREKRRKKEEQGKKKPCTPTPYSHPPQTHWSCTLHRRWLCRAAKHLILEWKLKVASESLTDTQTHSVHEREHFVYQKALSSVPVDTNDRADIFFFFFFFFAPTHTRKTWPGHAPH